MSFLCNQTYHKALGALLDLITPQPKLSSHDTQRIIPLSYYLTNDTPIMCTYIPGIPVPLQIGKIVEKLITS